MDCLYILKRDIDISFAHGYSINRPLFIFYQFQKYSEVSIKKIVERTRCLQSKKLTMQFLIFCFANETCLIFTKHCFGVLIILA